MKHQIVFVRHGQSTWNQQNIFTGWTDVPLTDKGVQEAKNAGLLLKNYQFDIAFTSYLKRAIITLNHILEENDQMHIDVIKSWKLNERHYGALQGLNKAETAEKHGVEQVKIWRRSYDVPPPHLDDKDERAPVNDKKYKGIDQKSLPLGESLKDTVDRVLPYWFDEICKQINNNKQVLVVAHGNSLRAIIQYLDNMDKKDVLELNIPTGVPLVYELDGNLKPIKHYYLGDQNELEQKIQEVANQAQQKSN